jgi:nucleoside-diphosphate-sugar epimerase
MRALVTGATGFVGRNLCAHLVAAGWSVVAVHRDSSSTEKLDGLREGGVSTQAFSEFSELAGIVKSAQPDVVFHLAAYFVRFPRDRDRDLKSFIDANVTFGTYLLDALVGTSAVVINAASYFQYRAGEPAPNSLYASTKQAFVEIARFYTEQRSLDIRTVVLNDNYGPADDREKLVNELVAAAIGGNPIALGNGDQWMNLIHIQDLVAALVAAAQPGEPRVMAIRADEDVTVGDVVALIGTGIGGALEATFDNDRATDDRVLEPGTWPRPSGWSPRIPLDVGLKELLS